ncbi:hypothetical protein BDW68DRAFT_192480 [Aspergillus falconensis]
MTSDVPACVTEAGGRDDDTRASRARGNPLRRVVLDWPLGPKLQKPLAPKFLPRCLLTFSLRKQLGQGAQNTEIRIPEISDKVLARNASSQRQVGHRITGFVHRGQYEDINLMWKVPEGVSDAQVATYVISAVTAMPALAYLDVPRPDLEHGQRNTPGANEAPILIYPGASNVVLTASPRSFNLVNKYRADAVFDYRTLAVANEITKHALTTGACSTPTKSDVNSAFLIVFTAFGKEFPYAEATGPEMPVAPAGGGTMRKFYASLPGFAGDVLQPPSTTVTRGGGLENALKGLDRLLNGYARRTKLVVEY